MRPWRGETTRSDGARNSSWNGASLVPLDSLDFEGRDHRHIIDGQDGDVEESIPDLALEAPQLGRGHAGASGLISGQDPFALDQDIHARRPAVPGRQVGEAERDP